jgi:pyruvate formate lyase activating enzyme
MTRINMHSPFIRKALLQEAADNKARCLTCERRCLLADGQVGWCRTRQNLDGTLYTLIYGLVSSLSCNPIEKKPLYHFYPGSLALTAGSLSCNFDCPWCQNWHISKDTPPAIGSGSPRNHSDRDHLARPWRPHGPVSQAPPGGGRYVSPQDLVLEAVEQRCGGTSISFNEPTLSLEWSLEVFRLAHERGLYNTFVSNGYMTPEALRLLVEAGLDAINIDVKGDAQAVRRYCGADVDKVWRNCRLAHQAGVWLEITTLVIPGVNDRDLVLRGIAERIVADVGADVPWHVSGYSPAYRFTAPRTPLATLERVWRIGKEAGLRFVYLGNVAGHRLENTYCPDCEALLVRRRGLGITGYHVDRGRCPRCGRELPGMWTALPLPQDG